MLSVIARADAGVPAGDLAKLKGKKIGVTRGAGGEPYIVGLLKQVGLTPEDVTLVNTAPSNMATALANKDADVIASWEPWPSRGAHQGAGRVQGDLRRLQELLRRRRAGDDEAGDRRQGSKALEKFVLGYAQGQAWARANRDEAAKISTRWIPGMDAETLTLALKSLPLDVRMSKNTLDGFKTYSIPLLVSQKRIPAGIRPDHRDRQPVRRRRDEGRSGRVRGPEGTAACPAPVAATAQLATGRSSECADAGRRRDNPGRQFEPRPGK